MFNKILVPLDMSELAEQVLPHVIELARAFDSEVNIINICQSHVSQETLACQSYLDKAANSIQAALSDSEIKVKRNIVTGVPDKQIVDYALAEKVDLIFMTSHGKSGAMLWPIGSTADKVLRRTRVPLIVVRAQVSPVQGAPTSLFYKILVPLDGSELGAKVLPFVAGIAGKIACEIILIHIVDTDKRVHSLGRVDTVPFLEEEVESLKKRADDYLKEQSRKFEGSGAKVSTVVRVGNVAKEIIQYAAENKCTLIALSSHGHSGFEAWVIGSVTNKILQSGQKSVLFAPAIEQ